MVKQVLSVLKKLSLLNPSRSLSNSALKTTTHPVVKTVSQPSVQYSQSTTQSQFRDQPYVSQKPVAPEAGPLLGHTQPVTQVGGGQSTWQPPDWAIEPRPGVYYLEILKDGEFLDRISLDRRRHIFGRQIPTCDFVLDHQSVSRQHAAVIPHKNGSIFVIDLGSAHALFPRPPPPSEINLPPPPDPSDEEAVVAYNTFLNRYGLTRPDQPAKLIESSGSLSRRHDDQQWGRAAKRMKKGKGVTSKLQEVLNRVKTTPKSGMYDDLYGESFNGKVGSSWAYSSESSAGNLDFQTEDGQGNAVGSSSGKPENNPSAYDDNDDDDLFGD
ncbi:hypothetical protein OIU84_026788 [Salix udensis]|uniref:FHA domain-containing protein n=1 Tax=Salix udensis TaxID=889485 RepID=A0AAD6PF61_9ROSI|nr:hypothetical protein OIU84_026788 [Salix udensis]